MLIDGTEATSEALRERLTATDGHGTSLQVNQGRIRELSLHLDALDRASEALFGEPAPLAEVLASAKRVVAAAPLAATLRIEIFGDPAGHQRVLVEATEAAPRPRSPHRLDVVRHERLLPGIQHTALGSSHFIDRVSRRGGFDGAVLVTSDGHVVEAADGSLGLISGRRVVWPEGSARGSIGRTLLDPFLTRAGLATAILPVLADDLPLFDGAFLVCSRGAAPVATIGDMSWQPMAEGSTLAKVLAIHDEIPDEPLAGR